MSERPETCDSCGEFFYDCHCELANCRAQLAILQAVAEAAEKYKAAKKLWDETEDIQYAFAMEKHEDEMDAALAAWKERGGA
jgi:hypothetical protein